MSTDEAIARGVDPSWPAELEGAGRVVRMSVAGVERWCAVEDVARLRDALGVDPPPGVPKVFLEPVDSPLVDLVSRYARTHGPFTSAEVAERFGVERGAVEGALAEFTPLWQRAVPDERWRGLDTVFEVVESLRGASLVASTLESSVLPARVEGYVPASLDLLTQAGEVVWAGVDALPGGDGRLMLVPAQDAPSLLSEPVWPKEGSTAAMVLEVLREGGALFFRDIVDRVGRASGGAVLSDADVVAALWEAVWSGCVTNDTLGPLRAVLGSGPAPGRSSRSRRRPVLPTRSGPPTTAGRWSVSPMIESDPTRRVPARVEARLEREGILFKGRRGGGISQEEYRVLRSMEEAGRVRRGYFVEGLGGTQFALPGAVDRLRAVSTEPGVSDPVVLAATDPANPFGVEPPWPESGDGSQRPGRTPGALVVLDGDRPTLHLTQGGRSASTFGASPALLERAAEAVAGLVRDGVVESLTVERVDGVEVFGTALDSALVAAGFHVTPKGLRLRR